MSSTIIVADLVKAYPTSREAIVAAFLFDTSVQNRQHPDSDVDVGVLLAAYADFEYYCKLIQRGFIYRLQKEVRGV